MQINAGDTFTLRVVDNDKYDVSDYDITGDNTNILKPDIMQDGDIHYLLFTFIALADTFNIDFSIFNSELDDYVVLFKLLMT